MKISRVSLTVLILLAIGTAALILLGAPPVTYPVPAAMASAYLRGRADGIRYVINHYKKEPK